jgi:acyl-CoA synthetase (NDP forming)
MAGGEKIWKAFFRQTGAVQVDSLEEMADVLLAFHHLGTSQGRKTAVFGIGGGNGVAVADNCARAGLELPALSTEVINRLKKTIAHDGAMIRNPIDSVSIFVNLQLMGDTMELLAESGEIDNFILSMPVDLIALSMGNYAEIVAEYLATEGRKRTHGKPLIVVWRQYQPDPSVKQSISAMEKILLSAGIPVYQGLSRAASALSKLVTYSAFCTEAYLDSCKDTRGIHTGTGQESIN